MRGVHNIDAAASAHTGILQKRRPDVGVIPGHQLRCHPLRTGRGLGFVDSPFDGSVANFTQEVMKGQLPLSAGELRGQGRELFGRSAILVSGLDYQLSFLEHVHEFNTD